MPALAQAATATGGSFGQHGLQFRQIALQGGQSGLGSRRAFLGLNATLLFGIGARLGIGAASDFQLGSGFRQRRLGCVGSGPLSANLLAQRAREHVLDSTIATPPDNVMVGLVI